MNQTLHLKRAAFAIFVDKDGTINLQDKRLNNIFKLIPSMHGIIIPTTGRTVGDMLEELDENNLMRPLLIIGDNGGCIYSTRDRQFLYKKTLNAEKVENINSHFIKLGGNSETIRLTDGEFIYAVNNPDVQAYYRKKHTVKYGENIEQLLETMPEITKITLAGTKPQMQEMASYVESLNFWSDMGATKFPNTSYQHYRLDIADRNINKGNAVKLINSTLKPPSGYMCIGNGENDISMFKQAIDDGMLIGIMEDSPQSVIKEMKAYVALKKKRQNDYYSCEYQ